MDMRPQGQPPSLYRPNGGGKRKGFRLKIGVGVQEGVHHLPVFPGQQRTGAIQKDAARPDIGGYIVQNRPLYSRQSLQRSGVLIADSGFLRMMPNPEQGTSAITRSKAFS
jgi:hypothetical protein